MINRTIAPAIKEPVAFDVQIPRYQKYTLANGVEVYALNMGDEDTLMVNWVFYAGNWYEEKNLVAAATASLLKNGTTKRSAFDINEHFDYYGSFLSRSCHNETAEITLHCLNKHVDELLPVVAEILTESVFSPEELAIFKQNSKQRLRVSLEKCEFVAGRLIDAYLFGENHPYGRYSTLEAYEALDRQDLLTFYQQYYTNGCCIIFVAGKMPVDFIAKLEKHFGSLPLRPHTVPDNGIQHPIVLSAQKKFHVLNDPDGVQGAIRIARPMPNRHHPDFQKVQVLNHLFGGFFGSRLMANIREDKGYTYGIHSYLMNYMQESGWMISTEAGRDVCQATIDEVYAEMEDIRLDLIDDEELMTTRNYMIGTILGDLDGPFQVIARWKNMILNNMEESYFHNGIHIIKTTTAEELQALANKYLKPEDFMELVVI